jgi:hypothetical protein
MNKLTQPMKITEPHFAAPEQLMPYGEAAKAIFVKANGLPAYNEEIRCDNLYCSELYEQTSANDRRQGSTSRSTFPQEKQIMRQAHITSPATDLNYLMAAQLAATYADQDAEVIDPVLVAWYDRKAARMSPVIEGSDLRTRWHDYGASHGGKLEIDVAGDFTFIYADASPFDPFEAGPYRNLHDAQGNEYLCQTNLLRNPLQPMAGACTPLNDWTSKLT